MWQTLSSAARTIGDRVLNNRAGCCFRCGREDHDALSCKASEHKNGKNLFTVYVLKLESGKWYVGSTKNLNRRLDQHRKGNGSAWTKRYKYVDHVQPETPYQKHLWELAETLTMMKKYGAENVRGSMFTKTQDALRIEQLQTVFNLVCEDENLCRKCGSKDHFAGKCKNSEVQPWVQVAIPRFCQVCNSPLSGLMGYDLCPDCYKASCSPGNSESLSGGDSPLQAQHSNHYHQSWDWTASWGLEEDGSEEEGEDCHREGESETDEAVSPQRLPHERECAGCNEDISDAPPSHFFCSNCWQASSQNHDLHDDSSPPQEDGQHHKYRLCDGCTVDISDAAPHHSLCHDCWQAGSQDHDEHPRLARRRACANCGVNIDSAPGHHSLCSGCWRFESSQQPPEKVQHSSQSSPMLMQSLRLCDRCNADINDRPPSHQLCLSCWRAQRKLHRGHEEQDRASTAYQNKRPKNQQHDGGNYYVFRRCEDCQQSLEGKPRHHRLCQECWQTSFKYEQALDEESSSSSEESY